MEKLLTAEQAAEILGLKLVTVRCWMANRAIGSVRLGKRSVRIPESEIRRLIDTGRVPALPERTR